MPPEHDRCHRGQVRATGAAQAANQVCQALRRFPRPCQVDRAPEVTCDHCTEPKLIGQIGSQRRFEIKRISVDIVHILLYCAWLCFSIYLARFIICRCMMDGAILLLLQGSSCNSYKLMFLSHREMHLTVGYTCVYSVSYRYHNMTYYVIMTSMAIALQAMHNSKSSTLHSLTSLSHGG